MPSFETDLISGWLGNDEGRHNEARLLARRAASKKDLATALKEWHLSEMQAVETQAPAWLKGLMASAFSEVDWEEVADDFWEEPEGEEGE